MAVLLLAEMNGTELSLDATAKAVTAAKSLGDITVLCASSDCDVAASAASQIEGVSKVLCACLLYTSPSPRDKRQSRMPSSA